MTNRNASQTTEAPQTSAPQAAATAPAEEAARASFVVMCPPQLKVAIEAAAKTADKSISEFVRNLLAPAIGYTGPMMNPATKRTKYATPEEKEAAQKKASKDRRDLTAMLLKRYRDEKAAEAAKATAPSNTSA